MDVGTSHRRRRVNSSNELITPDRGQFPPTFPIRPIAQNDAKKSSKCRAGKSLQVPTSIASNGREKEKEDRERVLAKVFFV